MTPLTEHKRIYLTPSCAKCDDYCERLWCEDDQGACDECDKPWTEYVIASELTQSTAALAVVTEALRKAVVTLEMVSIKEDGFKRVFHCGICKSRWVGDDESHDDHCVLSNPQAAATALLVETEGDLTEARKRDALRNEFIAAREQTWEDAVTVADELRAQVALLEKTQLPAGYVAVCEHHRHYLCAHAEGREDPTKCLANADQCPLRTPKAATL